MNADKDSHISQKACIAKYSKCTKSDLNIYKITLTNFKQEKATQNYFN